MLHPRLTQITRERHVASRGLLVFVVVLFLASVFAIVLVVIVIVVAVVIVFVGVGNGSCLYSSIGGGHTKLQ